MMRSLRIAAVGAFVALAVAACSSKDDSSDTLSNNPPAATTTTDSAATTPPASSDSGGGTAASTGTITIQNFQFGQPLTVKPGATITVTNKDSAPHDVVADDNGGFKTDTLDQNQSATFTAPTKAGTYKFSCSLHANMTGTGTLVVEG